MDDGYLTLLSKYILFLFASNLLLLLLVTYPSPVYAGIFGDILDSGVKFAALYLWKGLGGLALFLGGSWLIAKRPPFKFKIMAHAVAFMLYCMSVIGVILIIAELWPNVLKPAVEGTAEFIRGLING